MVSLLHVALENAGSRRLVEARSLQDVGGIDPVIGLASHDMFAFGIGPIELEFPDWILQSQRKEDQYQVKCVVEVRWVETAGEGGGGANGLRCRWPKRCRRQYCLRRP